MKKELELFTGKLFNILFHKLKSDQSFKIFLVLLVSSLRVSPVAEDSDYFLESSHNSHKEVELFHSLVWVLQ